MHEIQERYELIMEPADTWMIYDTVQDLPTVCSGVLLCGLSEADAIAACRFLNETDKIGTHQESSWMAS